MTTDFERFIRNAESEVNRAKSTLDTYQKERDDIQRRHAAENPRYKFVIDKVYEWKREVELARRVLDQAKNAAASAAKFEPMPPTPAPAPAPAPKADKPKPVSYGDAVAEPAKTEVEEKPSHTFRASPVTSVFDRDAARRAVRFWRASYPLAKTYKYPSKLEKQALTTEIRAHERYRDWLKVGNVRVTDGTRPVLMEELVAAAEWLGLDAAVIREEARRVYVDISTLGERGKDYLW